MVAVKETIIQCETPGKEETLTQKERRDNMEERFTIRKRGQITLPKAIIDELNIKEGDQMTASIEDNKVVLTPMMSIPVDQAWFWTKEWQEKERLVDEEKKEGRIKSGTIDDLFKELHSDDEDN